MSFTFIDYQVKEKKKMFQGKQVIHRWMFLWEEKFEKIVLTEKQKQRLQIQLFEDKLIHSNQESLLQGIIIIQQGVSFKFQRTDKDHSRIQLCVNGEEFQNGKKVYSK